MPLCNHHGTVINDPILSKLADDLYWISIADSDIWFWASAIAAERDLNIEISEPDVSPMALQGPKTEDVVAHALGDWVRALNYFRFKETEFDGIPVAVQRSGWSKQGGFEIHLKDGSKDTQLWNIFKEAGKPWDIGPGAPATPERVESGLVSVGGDMDDNTSPFEVRLGKYVDLDVADDVVGIHARRRIMAEGIKCHHLGLAHELAEEGQGLQRAKALAKQIATCPPKTNFAITTGIARINDMPTTDGFFAEGLLQTAVQANPDTHERPGTFFSKSTKRLEPDR